MGVRPGDTLIKNDFLSVVILTGVRDSKSMRVGQCVVLDGSFDGNREPIAIGPGPRGLWKKAELVKSGSAILVRFRHQEDDWAAELLYRLDGASPWLEIQTTLRNRSEERTLEIPAVDDLRAPEKSTVADDAMEAVTISRDNPGWVVAIAPSEQKALVKEAEGDRWFIIFESGDPTPSVLKRMRPKLLPLLGSGELYQPVDVERDWTRFIKDRERWFRIEPNGERKIVRRVMFGPTMNDTKSLVAFARGRDAQSTKLAETAKSTPAKRSGRISTSSAKPPVGTERTGPTSNRIVGTLRGKQPKSAAKPSPESATPFVAKPVGDTKAQWRQASPATAKKPAVESSSHGDSAKTIATPASILNIPNLPPPVDDGK
jgi:hypothetical protein